MKKPNKLNHGKTTSNGKGDVSPKLEKIRCKCTGDCCCPNSKLYKESPKNREGVEGYIPLKRQVSIQELLPSKCRCADAERGKGKKESKTPCKDQDCACELPTNAVSLRNKIIDLDNALKIHGRGNKRKTKNVQQKSIQISETYEDPETKKKNIITLTEKSQVKIEIRTFCDDTRRLEKNRNRNKNKNKGSKGSSNASIESDTNIKKSKKKRRDKEKTPKERRRGKKNLPNTSIESDASTTETKKKRGDKEKTPKDPNNKKSSKSRGSKKRKINRGLFGGCFKRKKSSGSLSRANSEDSRTSDIAVLYQTAENPCKDGPCLGIKAFSKTEKVGDGIVNTNTVVFPENFTGNLSPPELTNQLNQQTKEIEDIRKSIAECLKILKSGKNQAVYMLSDMTERSNPNYFTVYSHASDRYHKKSGRDCKASDYTYDPEHKVRDWITHGSLKHRHHRDRSHSHNHHVSRISKDLDKGSVNKSHRTSDRFDAELEDYLKICRHEYQVYKSAKEAKPPKEKKSKASKASKVSKKTKKSKKDSKADSGDELKCDRVAADCYCGPDCAHLGIQTSNISSTDKSKSKNDAQKAMKARKEARKQKRGRKKASKTGVNSEEISTPTEKSEDVTATTPNSKNKPMVKESKIKNTIVDWMDKFVKCVLCRPY